MPLDVQSISNIVPYLQKLVWIFLLLCLSAFFSGTETALFSLSRAQQEAWAQEKKSAGRRVAWLLRRPRQLITTLILGNELINISLSTIVTGIVSSLFPLLQNAWLGLIATICTVPLLILFGEFIPKTIAIRLAPFWSRVVAGPMILISWILALPRIIISAISGAIIFLLLSRSKQKESSSSILKERELRTLVDLGSAEGEIQTSERNMIHNVFDFSDTPVEQVMTNASKIFSVSIDVPLSKLLEQVAEKNYARIPLYRGKPENIVGILFAKDLVGYQSGDLQQRGLSDLLAPAFFVPKRAKCERLFREFQKRKMHMALVVDEYGKLAGVVTMDDLLHALFGNLSESEHPKNHQPLAESAS